MAVWKFLLKTIAVVRKTTAEKIMASTTPLLKTIVAVHKIATKENNDDNNRFQNHYC